MNAMQNAGDCSANSDIIVTNGGTNDTVVVRVGPEDAAAKGRVSPIGRQTPANNQKQLSVESANTAVDDNNKANTSAKKSSNRNAINFLVLGYFFLVVIITYAYFGSFISDVIANQTPKHKIKLTNQTTVLDTNSTLSETKTGKTQKFYKTITSIELIIILWVTLVYGSALLLYLRFRVLHLERDPNRPKKKKKKETAEELEDLMNSRRNRRSFKDKSAKNTPIAKDNSTQPFWQK